MAKENITIQPPLSRRGKGPPLILLVNDNVDISAASPQKTVDPPPSKKWAEEGYAVAQITVITARAPVNLVEYLKRAQSMLEELPSCQWSGHIALISYIAGDEGLPSNITKLSSQAGVTLDCIVSYGAPTAKGFEDTPYLAHIATRLHKDGNPVGVPSLSFTTVYHYPEAAPLFVLPAHESYRASSAAVAHTRTLSFMKPKLNGPYFDLEAIWEEHTRFEFAERSVERTMATMVDEPYVNHVPTLTGGIGRTRLSDFYRDHFIFNNPPDLELELVSRTVGIDRVIDEFLLKLTHDRVVDWLWVPPPFLDLTDRIDITSVPGLPPTGKHISVPFTSVVNVRGDKLFHEHIAWDQATLLRQLGLLPDYLPFPYPLADGTTPASGKRFEYRLPVAGIEAAQKLTDESAVESNEMFSYTIREVNDS